MTNYGNFIRPDYGPEEKKAVADYLDSGGWLTEYKKTRELERMIAEFVGAKHCAMVPSCTTALAVAVMALDIDGDIVVPDYTMVASANAVAMAGFTPWLADVDRETFCLLTRSSQQRPFPVPFPHGVMLVSMNGRYPRCFDEILEFCKEHNVALIEDAAQSLGSRFRGRSVGTYGKAGCFSFSMFKTITTGQGGAIVTDDAALYDRIEKLKNFGRNSNDSDSHDSIGYNYHFTDLQAVIGIEQMKKLPYRIQRKKEILKFYKETIKPDVVAFPETMPETALWLFDVLSDDPVGLRTYLSSKGIGTRPAYPGLHKQSPYRSQRHRDFSGSEYASSHLLYLPSGHYLTDDDLHYICDAVNSYGR